MRRLIQASVAAAIATALLADGAGAVPPKAGQVDIGGEAQRFVDTPANFGPKDLDQRTAFERALQVKEPAARAAAFEAFLKAYPDSRGRRNALLQLVSAYGLADDAEGLQAAGRRLTEAFPEDIPALAVVVDCERRAAVRAADPAAAGRLAQAAAANAQKGLAVLPSWRRPDSMSKTAFAAAQAFAEAAFEQALGYAALRDKDYGGARTHLARAAALQADDWSTLEFLAAADLWGQPPDPAGFWYAARAMALARAEKNEPAAREIEQFARKAYVSYHGQDDGWDQITAAAAGQAQLPAGFTVVQGRSPARLAVLAVQRHDPAGMSFSDWEAVLAYRDASPENAAAAAKVWAAVQAVESGGTVRVTLPAKVVAATSTTIDAAVGDDSRASGAPDVHATLSAPLAAPPKPGDEIQLSGVLDSYTPQPFAFHMARARVEK